MYTRTGEVTMPKVELRPGMFGWCDLATHDVSGAIAFYGALFGWQNAPVRHEDHVVYQMFTLDGDKVAGLVDNRGWGGDEKPPPPLWISYVIVDDVDDVASRVDGLGGTVLRPPMDIMDSGRMAFVQDPTGAMVAFWEPRAHVGADRFNEPGALVWNELTTRDLDTSTTFYGELLGWDWRVDDRMETGPYHMAIVDGRPTAGIMAMPEGMDGVPDHWAVYFQVDDVDATIEGARTHGGGVAWGPEEVAVGRLAVLRDPQGGHFSIFTPAAPQG